MWDASCIEAQNMRKTIFICALCVVAASSQAALIEWASPEKYLDKPVCEEDKEGGFLQIIRYKLAKEGHQLVEKKWRRAGEGDLIVWNNIGRKKIFKRISLLRKKQ